MRLGGSHEVVVDGRTVSGERRSDCCLEATFRGRGTSGRRSGSGSGGLLFGPAGHRAVGMQGVARLQLADENVDRGGKTQLKP